MAKRYYNKLVRDKVPDAIVSGGDKAVTTVLDSHDAFLAALDEKLDEELVEYQMSKSLSELADVLEVVYAIAESKGSSIEELNAIRLEKREKRGGFSRKILLKEIIE